MKTLAQQMASLPQTTRQHRLLKPLLEEWDIAGLDRARSELVAQPRAQSKPYLHALETSRLRSLSYEEVLAELCPVEGKLGSLYLHVPFCTKRCSWCHYYKEVGVPGQQISDFPDYLLRELALLLPRLGRQRLTTFTIHYGGGTPTLLTEDAFTRLMQGIEEVVAVEEGDEIAVECDPEDVTDEQMAFLRERHVNRISLGTQSFDAGVLQLLRRGHDSEVSRRSFISARRAGFPNINIDLMYGMPGQTWPAWLADLETVLELRPESITVYATRPDPRDTLERSHDFPVEEERLLMHLVAASACLAAGYVQFSPNQFIHSWAGACLAKEQRNRCGNILGLGPLAHSIVKSWFYFNKADLDTYRERLGAGRLCEVKGQRMTAAEERIRFVQFALKLSGVNKGSVNNGLSRADYQSRFGEPLQACFGSRLEFLQSLGLIQDQGDSVHLTLHGSLLQRHVLRYLGEEGSQEEP